MSNVIALIGHMTDEQKIAVCDRVEAVVDRLTTVLEEMLVALDQLDGEPDLEPTMGYVPPGYVDEAEGGSLDEEPSLGWTATGNQTAPAWRGSSDRFGCVDVEAEHDGREPELGVVERHPSPFFNSWNDCSQEWWATRGARYSDEREEDHEIEQPHYQGG